MIAYSFIIESGGKTERMDLECDRLLVGSGAHCDIRLAEEEAAFEHLVITWEGDAMVARVIPDDAIAYVDGAIFRDAVLADGSVISLRGAKLTYLVRENVVEQKPVRARGTSPLAYVGLLVIVVGFALLLGKKRASGLDAPENVPDPLAAPVTQCPATTRQQAVALAVEKETLGQAKRQRWKFYARDGVEAVGLFELAAVCYGAGGEAERAAEIGILAQALRSGVLQEFQLYRVRLERALARGDHKVALAQIGYLRDMLYAKQVDDDYVRWLTIMQRKLEAQASRES